MKPKCAVCLKLMSDNPHLSPRQLFPLGEAADATTIKNGTAVCTNHMKNV